MRPRPPVLHAGERAPRRTSTLTPPRPGHHRAVAGPLRIGPERDAPPFRCSSGNGSSARITPAHRYPQVGIQTALRLQIVYKWPRPAKLAFPPAGKADASRSAGLSEGDREFHRWSTGFSRLCAAYIALPRRLKAVLQRFGPPRNSPTPSSSRCCGKPFAVTLSAAKGLVWLS